MQFFNISKALFFIFCITNPKNQSDKGEFSSEHRVEKEIERPVQNPPYQGVVRKCENNYILILLIPSHYISKNTISSLIMGGELIKKILKLIIKLVSRASMVLCFVGFMSAAQAENVRDACLSWYQSHLKQLPGAQHLTEYPLHCHFHLFIPKSVDGRVQKWCNNYIKNGKELIYWHCGKWPWVNKNTWTKK